MGITLKKLRGTVLFYTSHECNYTSIHKDAFAFLIGYLAISYRILCHLSYNAFLCLRPCLPMPASVLTYACAHAYLCPHLNPGSYSFRFGAEKTWRHMRKKKRARRLSLRHALSVSIPKTHAGFTLPAKSMSLHTCRNSRPSNSSKAQPG